MVATSFAIFDFTKRVKIMTHIFHHPFFRTTIGRLVLLALVLSLLSLPTLALANATGGGLPYEDGLKKLTESIKGPVAFAISLIGIVAAGAALIFGGEMSGFLRTMIFLVLVIAIIVNASNLISFVGGDSALVADAISARAQEFSHSGKALA
jgi:type IV secretion system protein VirB2